MRIFYSCLEPTKCTVSYNGSGRTYYGNFVRYHTPVILYKDVYYGEYVIRIGAKKYWFSVNYNTLSESSNFRRKITESGGRARIGNLALLPTIPPPP